MTFYQWLCIFSVPALLATVFKLLFSQIRAMKKGLQALLRAQLITEYKTWTERGYAPVYARDNFENCYAQYHSLGKNGVMDDIHAKFFELPDRPPEE